MIFNSRTPERILKFIKAALVLCVVLASFKSVAQKAYFIDGFHGGVYGHYPPGYTAFIVEKLKENPWWNINLEIEPETWDTILIREPAALKELQQLFADQSNTGRIEYVSPAYGQSYLYTISGESIIRQFSYGIKKVREYFPGAVFTTYSSEEPCFTSSLPQILKSYGYKYASLKNPNTCWGGYTRSFGGELVNWVGPDGTKLTTVPRYAVEGLLANSTWQTEGFTNSPKYINTALKYGIQNPVAMTLQDAGWKGGPYIGNGNRGYQPTEYKTWRGYIENSSIKTAKQDWHFSQEDVLVSLVWGSQVLQRIAQQVRVSENKIVMAEKLGALAKVYVNTAWPQTAIDEAWRTLMLSQHHDCWIVPYNGRPGNTWADKVKVWTDGTNRVSDSIIHNAFTVVKAPAGSSAKTIRVYNTTGNRRNEFVKLLLPESDNKKDISIVDETNKEMVSQTVLSYQGTATIYFKADVPPVGFNTYTIVNKKPSLVNGAHTSTTSGGDIVLETDLYKLTISKSKGTIKSLIAKTLNKKEFVDNKNERGFNEMGGNFFNDGGFHSSSENPVTVTVTDQGPAIVKAEIRGTILNHPYTQQISLRQGERRIDCNVRIDWKGNVGIGEDYKQHGGLDSKDYNKPFYDDSKKLLATFPVNFSSEKIYKDAPFDVTESSLDNTFFRTWDSIKNNIMVSWVDVYDPKNNYGLALLTDHTTTYAHGENFPLALNVQYSGMGLWGRNNTIIAPTEINYALVPHVNKWDGGHISTEVANWNEPLVASSTPTVREAKKSLVDVTGTGLQVTTVLVDGNDLLVRLFNAEGDSKSKVVVFGGSGDATEMVELNGTVKQALKMQTGKNNTSVSVSMPRFGIRTIRLKNFNQ